MPLDATEGSCVRWFDLPQVSDIVCSFVLNLPMKWRRSYIVARTERVTAEKLIQEGTHIVAAPYLTIVTRSRNEVIVILACGAALPHPSLGSIIASSTSRVTPDLDGKNDTRGMTYILSFAFVHGVS